MIRSAGNSDGGEDENDMNGVADNIGNTVGNNASRFQCPCCGTHAWT